MRKEGKCEMELKIKHFEELTADELYEILKARQEVFIVEQNCPYVDADGKDKNAYHVFVTENGRVLAALRVLDRGVSFPEVSIGRVITTKRGSGLGREIILSGIRVAKEKYGADRIKISAQVQAEGFYKKQGFSRVSDRVYLEDGIEHIEMEMLL